MNRLALSDLTRLAHTMLPATVFEGLDFLGKL